MDFHAHLDRHEIIGLLAGAWLPEQRLLRVERAFPVREAIASGAANDGINVEMDPEDQFKVCCGCVCKFLYREFDSCIYVAFCGVSCVI